MSTQGITAYVVIETMEPEGLCPYHWAYLVEGESLHWFIPPPGFYSPPDRASFKTDWVTTPSTLVEDLMLGVGEMVERLPFLGLDILSVADRENGEVVDPGRLSPARRACLNRLNLEVTHALRLVVTVQAGSVLAGQIGKFREYDVGFEICMSSYIQTRRPGSRNRLYPAGGAGPGSLQLN